MKWVLSRLIAGAAIASTVSTSAMAWRVPVMNAANCPTNNPAVGWLDYISGKVATPYQHLGNQVGVEFRMAKQVGDPQAIGNLATNACYSVDYLGHAYRDRPAGFDTMRLFRVGNGKGPDRTRGQTANVNDYEINVYGVVLLYNDQGQVLDKKGRPVGVLLCYSSNECGAY